MKRIPVKLMAVLLTAALLLPAFPSGVSTAEEEPPVRPSASDFTINTYMAEKLTALFDFVYGDTPYFTAAGTTGCSNIGIACTTCRISSVVANHSLLSTYEVAVPSNAMHFGSNAFARFVTAYIYGYYLDGYDLNIYGNVSEQTKMDRIGRVASSKGSLDEVNVPAVTVENVRAFLQKGKFGDWLQGKTGNAQHSMVFLSADESGVTVLHLLDNATPETDKSRVVLSTYSYGQLTENWQDLIVLMRIKEPYFTNAWSKGDNVHDDHSYTDESGNVCAECGKETFVPVSSYAGAGVYTAAKDTVLYRNCYRSSGSNGASLAKGQSVNVTGSTVNSCGKTFYLASDGGYLAAEDVVSAEGGPSIEPESYPTGALPLGKSHRLSGTITDSAGIRYVWGYLISADGTTVQSERYSGSSPFNIASTVNKDLLFGTLPLGKYVYLVVAESKDTVQNRSFFKSEFSVVDVVDKTTPSAPSAPTVQSVTANSVTLKAVSGCEYRRGSGSWQSSPTFNGLSPATNYTFYQRYAETSTAYASAASAGRTVKTDKTATASAPGAPTVKSKTATSVTLNNVSGCEYRLDSGSWQSSPTFSGLSPLTSYTFYQRYAETSTATAGPASLPTTVTTDKSDSGIAPAPQVSGRTTTSVTLKAVSGCEYRIESGSWQSSPVFSGLTPGGEYTFYQRYAETANAAAGPVSDGLTVTLPKNTVSAPSAPSKSSVTTDTVTLKTVTGCEYSMDNGSWQSSPIFNGLTPGSVHIFRQRYAETATAYASEMSSALTLTLPKRQNSTVAPTPVKSSVSTTSVTLKTVSGCEYRLGSGSWQSSPTFSGLTPGMSYTFYQRYAETDTTEAGSISPSLTVTTEKRTVSAPSAPTVQSKTATTVTLNSVSGCEYRRGNGSWQSSPTFSGLSYATEYTFYIRYKETDTAYASTASGGTTVRTDKGAGASASAPQVSKVEDKKVTLQAASGMEYSMDGKNWQSSAVFTVSSYGEYTFYRRYAETATLYAGAVSSGLRLGVYPTELTSDSLQSEQIGDKNVLLADLGGDVAALLNKIDQKNYVTVRDADGAEVAGETRIATGMRLCLPGGEEYVLLVKGDLNGDGKCNIFDLVLARGEIIKPSLDSLSKRAADINNSGKVDIFDCVILQNIILKGN